MITCSKCSSDHVQSLPIVYQSGITGTLTQGTFSGTNFGYTSAGTTSVGQTVGNYQHVSTSQTNLSHYASPPIPKNFLYETKLGLAAAYLLNMLMALTFISDTGLALILDLILSPLFSIMALFKSSDAGIKGAAIIGLVGWFILPFLFVKLLPSAKNKKAWNKNQYPALYEQWSKSFFCNKCGNIFIPPYNPLRDTEGILSSHH